MERLQLEQVRAEAVNGLGRAEEAAARAPSAPLRRGVREMAGRTAAGQQAERSRPAAGVSKSLSGGRGGPSGPGGSSDGRPGTRSGGRSSEPRGGAGVP